MFNINTFKDLENLAKKLQEACKEGNLLQVYIIKEAILKKTFFD